MVLCVVKYKNISLCSFCTMWFYIFAQIYRIAFSHIVCIISHTGNTPVICLGVFTEEIVAKFLLAYPNQICYI